MEELKPCQMTESQQEAYNWAKNQNYPSVAARYAKLLAEMIDELNDFEHSQTEKLLAENSELRSRLSKINDLAVGYEEDGPFDNPQEAFDRVRKITNFSEVKGHE